MFKDNIPVLRSLTLPCLITYSPPQGIRPWLSLGELLSCLYMHFLKFSYTNSNTWIAHESASISFDYQSHLHIEYTHNIEPSFTVFSPGKCPFISIILVHLYFISSTAFWFFLMLFLKVIFCYSSCSRTSTSVHVLYNHP